MRAGSLSELFHSQRTSIESLKEAKFVADVNLLVDEVRQHAATVSCILLL